MILLAYDTSGPLMSVALFKGQKRLAVAESDPGARHSNVLLPVIEELLKKCSLTMEEIDVLAVGLGPGSFTGLRVGIATAKVLGYVLKKKIVGVSGLEAMAWEALDSGESRVAARMDARRGQVYGAVYEKKGGKVRTASSPALLTHSEFTLRARGAALVTAERTGPTASNIARAALPLAAQGKFTDPFKLEPLYLHARDCNVTYAKK